MNFATKIVFLDKKTDKSISFFFWIQASQAKGKFETLSPPLFFWNYRLNLERSNLRSTIKTITLKLF
jgi:hypothetical protein